MQMSLEKIETLLSQRMGLDPKSVGSRKIAKAVEFRQINCGVTNVEAYLELVENSMLEFEELVEQVIVPETWFFRDRKPFNYLQQYIITEGLPRQERPIFRLLSVPCCSGEEPYSIAITLLEAGLTPEKFIIDAIDISHQAIAKAKRAIYSKHSFRGEVLTDYSQYFQPTEKGYELCHPVRNMVNFRQGNMLTSLMLMQESYDVIFCRNVLIYLQQNACEQVMNAIEQRLSPGGLLFVGAAETAKIPLEKFTSIREPFTFAYRKEERQKAEERQEAEGRREERQRVEDFLKAEGRRQKASVSISRTAEGRRQRSEKGKFPPISPSPHLPTSPASPVSHLQTIRQLADGGKIAIAIANCQSYLQHHRTSAEAYILLGKLHQKENQNHQAEQCFKKALYLEPNSLEALINLANLKEQMGDRTQTEILRQRIQRLKQVSQT